MSRRRHVPPDSGGVIQKPDRQRIDKWLWHARVVRTRSAAAALASAGSVRVNGARLATASALVRLGDVVTIALDRRVRVLKVVEFVDRRGSPAGALALYVELTTSGRAAPSGQSLAKATSLR